MSRELKAAYKWVHYKYYEYYYYYLYSLSQQLIIKTDKNN